MEMEDRLHALRHVYAVYDRFARTIQTACEKFCARCCTRNVTATRLEALLLMDEIESKGLESVNHVRETLQGEPSERFRPAFTTNRLAEICAAGGDPPPEPPADPAWGPCGLLTDDACPVYDARPFACRCMVSATRCAEGGAAEMTPLIVTVNTVFMQTVEHLDGDGFSGNLADLLAFLGDPDHRQTYRTGRPDPPPAGLIPNRPVPVLMVPPEHREAVRPWLEALHRLPPRG
ncbi:MAG: hypothetical protein ACLFPR_19940 [Desulfococcaceae bacterium]